MYKHILIPTDGSKLAKDAGQAAVALARSLGARVTGFFAAPPATPIMFKGLLPTGYATPEEHEQNIRKAAQAYRGAIEKAASDYPADAIIAAVKKRRCDLIFMAPHGRRGVRRESLLGSETQKVLSQAPVPVLVYRKS